MRHQKNIAKPPLMAQTGWCWSKINCGLNEPPRPLHQRWLRDIFIDVAATPPFPRRGLRKKPLSLARFLAPLRGASIINQFSIFIRRRTPHATRFWITSIR
jgi:hypothetical protein